LNWQLATGNSPAKPGHCRHFGPCGGCDWQHLAYAEQLARKEQHLAELLRATLGARAPDIEPIIAMPVDDTGWPWRFRHKASFVFGDDRGRLTIGHYAARSNTIIPIVECPVHTDRANRIGFALHEHLARARISAAGKDLRGIVRHLLVRTTRDEREAVAMLVVTRNDKALRAPIKKFLASAERPTGFHLNIHDRPGPYMVGRETVKLEGHAHVREEIDGVSFLISPTAFFQTNVLAAATLVRLVLNHAPASPPLQVADLYCGSGLFALSLASRGHRVTAVEENTQAVKDGEVNVRLNRLPPDRVRFVAARVEDALARVTKTPFDLVVMDPPRSGCPDAVIDAVFATAAPPRVAYVSCNSEALARELPMMIARGYRVRRVQPVDMFPHTTHIETVVSLWAGRAGRAGGAGR
jgi:23S rRNA (uracil1939-C5)-methyltransferase